MDTSYFLLFLLMAKLSAQDQPTDSGFGGKGGLINSHDDATWILTSAFIIFTMQSGECLLLWFPISCEPFVTCSTLRAGFRRAPPEFDKAFWMVAPDEGHFCTSLE